MSKRKTFNVLSIDGGGIRGIIPAMILAEIERRVASIEGEDREFVPIAERFDLIAGTSTGGLLALGLSKRGGGGKQAEYAAQDFVDIYENRGRDIFNRSFWKGVSSMGDLTDEKYSAEGLESVLTEYFGDASLDDTHPTTGAMVTCYDIGLREPVFLKSWNDEHGAIRIRDAARATSAAPTYFEPIQICIGSRMRTLVDGGVFINTPVVSAYAEAQRLISEREEEYQHVSKEDIFVVSLGTGELTREIQYEEARDWGKVEWLLPVISCIFDGVSDAADYQMKMFVGEENYVRLQERLRDADDDMDNASKGNINNLKKMADSLIDSEAFQRICDRLIGSEAGSEDSD